MLILNWGLGKRQVRGWITVLENVREGPGEEDPKQLHQDEGTAEEVDQLLLQGQPVDGAPPAAVAAEVADHPQVDESPRRK